MKLIYTLKERYTIREASVRLSEVFSETITVENIIEFAGIGKIDLFLQFSLQPAVGCEYYQKPIVVDGKRKAANHPYKNDDTETIDFLSGFYKFSIEQNPELEKYCRDAIKYFERFPDAEDFEYDDFPFNDFVVINEEQKTWLLMESLDKKWLSEKGISSSLPWNNVKRYSSQHRWPNFSEFVLTKQEIERFEAANNKTRSASFSSKERHTLLKIILGLTLTNYEYNPHANRNSTAKEITSDLALHGLHIDEDTVRKWLNQSKEFLPPDWQLND